MPSITEMCGVEGCDNYKLTRGYCSKHYQRFWHHGTTNALRQNHGYANTPEWYSWKHMKQRCYRKNDPKYPRYGERGIKVCNRWLEKPNGFHNFLEDMGLKPGPEFSLGRIYNNGNYEPSNCRWETIEQQSSNTSRTVRPIPCPNCEIPFKPYKDHGKPRKYCTRTCYLQSS